MLASSTARFRLLSYPLVAAAVCFAAVSASTAGAQDDIADVPAAKHKLKDTPLEYYVIGGGEAAEAPADGYRVLVVLPGGDGGEAFSPFVKRIYRHALSEDYLVIQLISHPWAKNQRIVWPTEKSAAPGMKVSTEAFLARAVQEVGEEHKIDPRHVYALGWSSGGPAVYAATLAEQTPLTGAFVAMSVFKPNFLPPLERAKGRAYFLLHSPQDRVCPYRMAQAAEQQLAAAGAAVELQDYAGGHGWRGNVFGNLRSGMDWLESQAKTDEP